MARTLATRSLCTRDQVGAIIVDANDKVIGEGYNNPARYFEHNDKPCTEWCTRSQTADKPTGWRGANIPGSLEISSEKMYHVWPSGQYEEISDGDAFMRRYGGEPIYADKTDYSTCPALHAEANALITSDRSLRVGGIIYVTSHPCMTCAKLISNSGLTGVYVGHDGQHEYRRDSSVYGYLMGLGLRVWEVLHEPR